MAKSQPTLFSFFSKNQNEGQFHKKKEESQAKLNSTDKLNVISSIKIRGNDIKPMDLVWAKLEGYPWWPALVYEHPLDRSIVRNKQVHVQFFDDPPTRGWVRETFVKPYGSPESCGIPTYRDSEWVRARSEADEAIKLSLEERANLIVEMVPSDAEDSNDSSINDFDTSKENDLNVSNVKRKANDECSEKPELKRRRIIPLPEGEASDEDEYKPDGDGSSDDSGSSGVNENLISDVETDTESDAVTPVKESQKKVGTKRNASGDLPSASRLKQDPQSATSSSPSVCSSTKSKLSLFAVKGSPSSGGKTTETNEWPHTNLVWLQSNRIRDSSMKFKDDPQYNPRTLYVPEEFLKKQTPAMRQWWELKSQNFDTILFFKMGKFYELFHMDAILSIQELGLLMMKGDYAHTGFPEIAYGRYSSVLIEKGYKVARVEQTETPEMMEKRCKSISRPTRYDKVVRRELCRVTSRGTMIPTIMEGDVCDTELRYLLAVTERCSDGPGELREFGVAFIDTNIGIFHVGQFSDDRHVSRLRTLVSHYTPAQILVERGRVSSKTLGLLKALVTEGLLESLLPEKEFWNSSKTLTFLAESGIFKGENTEVQWPQGLKVMQDKGDSLGLTADSAYELAVSALGALIWCLQTCKMEEDLITRKKFEFYSPPDIPQGNVEQLSPTPLRKHMIVDGTTLRNLEVFENSSDGSMEGTLFQTLNRCSTPFGQRLLRNWLCTPLCTKSAIESRLDAIEDLRNNPHLMDAAKPLMKSLPDLEKLLSKIHSVGLKRSLDHPDTRAIFYEGKQYSQRSVTDFLSVLGGFKTIVEIVECFKGTLESLKSKLLRSVVTYQEEGGNLHPLKDVIKFFDSSFDHSLAKKEGKIIPSAGVDPEFDEAVKKIDETRLLLDDYLKEQCAFFSAKVTYWGSDKKRFQLEVPDHATKKANHNYELTSQRKGYRRYWTDRTKDSLADMMVAEEQRENVLRDIARRIFQQFDEHQKEWTAAIECIAVLDVLLSFTEFSLSVDSTRPSIHSPHQTNKPFLMIRDGRHPCSIKIFNEGDYIPNDVTLGGNESTSASLSLVTGPNMGGKSTLMRQTALLCVMAQMGCFVPASECRLSIVDRIFTRLGAWDRIHQGESTFFIEMAETASIMHHATPYSLVIVDELGRGTATYDGMAIAHSVVEALRERGSRTLFSTHYHTLVDEFKGIENVSLGHMACMVENENEEDSSQEIITFLYKFVEGACPKSYGFNAARLADLPESVIRSASKKAKRLESVNMRKRAFRLLFSDSSITNLKNAVTNAKAIVC